MCRRLVIQSNHLSNSPLVPSRLVLFLDSSLWFLPSPPDKMFIIPPFGEPFRHPPLPHTSAPYHSPIYLSLYMYVWSILISFKRVLFDKCFACFSVNWFPNSCIIIVFSAFVLLRAGGVHGAAVAAAGPPGGCAGILSKSRECTYRTVISYLSLVHTACVRVCVAWLPVCRVPPFLSNWCPLYIYFPHPKLC